MKKIYSLSLACAFFRSGKNWHEPNPQHLKFISNQKCINEERENHTTEILRSQGHSVF